MRSKLLVGFQIAIVLFLTISPAFAHHGVAGYDMEKKITLSGIVTSFNWSNPHCIVHLDVKDAKGEVKDWIIEIAAPSLMSRAGWTRNSLKPGDEVTAETHPAKNGAQTGISGSSAGLLRFVVNGQALPFR